MTEKKTEPKLSRANILGTTSTTISYKEAQAKRYVIVDVRSRAEYESGTVPGAVNVPLFDEDERSVIGTIYKHGGTEQAIDQGFRYVEHKLGELLGGFAKYKNSPFAIFCARGGMRSRSIVNLLNQTGHRAIQIQGGYKAFRTGVLESLEQFSQPLIVLHGLTGTGKTRIIQQLDNAIDLEDLAQHRSSLFGALDLQPRNQRNFEALLVEKIENAGTPPYFVEGESRKIGQVFIPQRFAQAMKGGVLINVTASIETRIHRIIEDYPVNTAEKRDEIEQILHSLTRVLGKKCVSQLVYLLKEDNLQDLVKILLLEYYDKRYTRSMSQYCFDLEISSENIDNCLKELIFFRKNFLV